MPKILTANHLVSGDVVFRAPGGDWVVEVDRAELLDDKDALARAETAAAADVDHCVVIGVEAIDVTAGAGRIVPVRLRERIRAMGPTVKSDHRADLKPFA